MSLLVTPSLLCKLITCECFLVRNQSTLELRLNKIQSESFKQQGRWRLRKRHWKSRASSNFIALILSRLIRQMLVIFLELISKGLYQSSEKEKEICCSVFPFSTKREIRNFHVVVVQRRQRNLRKSVMHVQSCFTNIILLLFCRSLSRCRRRSLSFLIGTLRSDDAKAAKTSLQKWICVVSVFIATIPTHSLCQM